MKFRKLAALIPALALFPLMSRADEGVGGRFAFGPQGGLTFPGFHVKNSTISGLYGNKNGWAGGLFLEFGLWTITLRPELNYVTKGYTVGNSVEVRNRYVEVPVLVKINPFSDFVVSPFIVVGPQWSKQVSADVTVSGATTSYNNTATNWDVSAVAGLGLEFNVSDSVGISVQGRYSYGFRDVDSSTTEVHERGFYALGGVAFTL